MGESIMEWYKSGEGLPTRKQLRLNTIILFFLFSCLASSSAFAACHAVSPSGSGSQTGADWNNAMAGIPATQIRGDIYYLADGAYLNSGQIIFQQAASGTSVIEFRKAQSYDNGSSCSPSIAAGWNTSTMGSGQASFTGSQTFYIATPYYTFNGNGNSTAPGCGGGGSTSTANNSTLVASPPTITDCGIKLVGSGNGSSGATNIVSVLSNNLTLEYVEMLGAGYSGTSGSGDLDIFGSGASALTIKHMYGHNSGCVYIQDIGDNSLVDHSYFWAAEPNGSVGCHGQAEFEAGGTSNGVRSNNVYRDIIGTAIWTFAAGSGTNNNWQFYNNVIWYSSPLASWVSSAGSAAPANGILACINSGVYCNNFTLVQNSIINVPSFGVPGILDENGSTGYVVKNNLWYADSFGVGFPGGGITQDHNSFLNSTTGCPSGTANVCDTSASNPFAGWSNGNFTLASDASDWNNRVSLGSPYTVDSDGTTFTTDRGAYQFTVAGSAPVPPTGLTVVVE
jgi:hypothetical protein